MTPNTLLERIAYTENESEVLLEVRFTRTNK